MKPKTMILMGVAVVCGLAASYMTGQLLAEREKDQEPQKEIVNMLVASRPLEMGLLVKNPKEVFSIMAVEKGKEPANAYTEQDYDSLKDRRLVNRLVKGQFVFPDDLVDKNKNSLAQRLPKGMRAVGIKVDEVSSAGGFSSLPMSRVDIISTIRRNDGDSISQVILEDVLVLAVGMETQRAGDKNAMLANTVTVALTPEDAELIALAQEMGTLRLILRGDDERKDNQVSSHTHGIRGERLLRGRGYSDKGGSSEVSQEGGLSQAGSLIHKVDDVQEKVKEQEKKAVVVVQAPPKARIHVLTIYNGPHGTRYPFKMDLKGHVITEEITQADPSVTDPAPPVVKPEPAAKKEEKSKAPVDPPVVGPKGAKS